MKNSLFLSLLFLAGCSLDLPYLWHISRGQTDLLLNTVSIKEALKKYKFTKEERAKLELIPKLKTFARSTWGKDVDESIYSSYAHLDRPYVTWVLRASPPYKLKAYKWDFPVIGQAPYKGFFDKEMAKEEARSFVKKGYDILLRGVTAYSTLSYFDDPILSSMLSYKESDFVALIFHELAHTVLFFKDHINFNERFAEFVGRKTAELFYLKQNNKEMAQNMRAEWRDEALFSVFMSKEYNSLDKWYKEKEGKINKEMKEKRLKEIQERFARDIQPQLQTESYNYFPSLKLNNALLLSYRSYKYNMEEFEKLFNQVGQSLKAFIEYCAPFEKEEDPEKAFSKAVSALKNPASS